MAHQNAGKEHRKRCHGAAEHTAVKLDACLETICILKIGRHVISCICPCQLRNRRTHCQLIHNVHLRSVHSNSMKCYPVDTAERPLSMPMQCFRLRWPTCNRWQQRPHIRRRSQQCARCCSPSSTQAQAPDRQTPPAAAPVFSVLASAAALPVLLALDRPASAADELPAATGAQQIVSGSDVVVGAGERAVAGAAQAVTASATSASLTDTVTTLLFFAAVAALSAITLGVLYLTITSWFDDRREKEDRDKYDQGAAATRGRTATAQSTKPKASKKPVSARGGGKGFGK